MSYNLRGIWFDAGRNGWDNRRSRLIQTIRNFNPVVIGSQEGGVDQIGDILKGLSRYRMVMNTTNPVKEVGDYYFNVAILYDAAEVFPISAGEFWLSETPDVKESSSWGSTYVRTAKWAVRIQHPNFTAPF